MARMVFASILLMAAAAAGCAPCCTPFDHCGPVYEGYCHNDCVHGRIGSAFSGGAIVSHGPAPAAVPTARPIAPAPTPYYPGR